MIWSLRAIVVYRKLIVIMASFCRWRKSVFKPHTSYLAWPKVSYFPKILKLTFFFLKKKISEALHILEHLIIKIIFLLNRHQRI